MNDFEVRLRNCFLPKSCTNVPANTMISTKEDPTNYRTNLRSHNESFDEVITYLTELEKQNLLMTLERLPDRDTRIDEIKKALDEGYQLDEIFKQPNFSLYALAALKEEKISGMAFTTSQLFYNVYYHQPHPAEIRTVQIFDGDAVNEEAHTMVDYTTKIGSGVLIPPDELEKAMRIFQELVLKENGVKINHPDLTPEQMVSFFELLRKLPTLEQQYMVVPEPNPPNLSEKAVYINQRLQQIGFNIFSHQIASDGKVYRVIPSKGMIQSYLLAKAPKEAPLLVTRFQLATIDDMHRMILEDQRPLCLDVTFLGWVEEADHYKCNRKTNDATIHDFYHGNLMADIPRKERLKLYAAADILKQGLKNQLEPTLKERIERAFYQKDFISSTVLEKIKKVIDRIIDMEHFEYRIARLLNKKITGSLFWSVIQRCVQMEDSPDASKWIYQCMTKGLIERGDYYRERFELGGVNLKQLLKELKEGNIYLQESLVEALNIEINALTFFSLVEKCVKGSSYLVKDKALHEINNRLTLENVELVIDCARVIGSHATLRCVTEFVADHFSEFVKKVSLGEFKQDTTDFMLKRIQTSLHLEYLINNAILKKDHLVFAFLMQGEEFIKSIINKVFTEWTLLQVALFKMDIGMINYLLMKGATPKLRPGQGSPSPVFIAASSGNIEVSLALVALGGEMTPLEESRFALQAQKAVELYQKVNAQNSYQFTNIEELQQWTVMTQWGIGASNVEALKSQGRGLEFLPNLDAFSSSVDELD